ncbi:MAG: energy transducer TonB [Gammaproteobacteria bacterium]|nr:energy transducer TonB [Gammaproteobacteria bacterium]
MPGLRYSVSALAGTTVAISMLWLMQLLVTSPSQKLPLAESTRLIEFVRLKREEKIQLKERTPPPPPEKSTPPPRPRLDLHTESQPLPPRLDLAMNLDIPLNFGDGPYLGPLAAAAQADSSFIPLSRQPPQYPYKAARRGIEGWVRVAFDVTTTGSVDNVEVIESDPPGEFDKAAINAVYRWRFKPRIVNGVAVSGKASQVVEFTLNK